MIPFRQRSQEGYCPFLSGHNEYHMRPFYTVSLLLLLALFIAPESSSAKTGVRIFHGQLGVGDRGDLVRDLQNILKSDPAIYPEGLVTGYYGQLTEAAIKRLQRKYGLLETGVLDEETQKIIFPSEATFEVIAPNGGESWDKSELHTILWKTTFGPIVVQGREVAPAASLAPVQGRPSLPVPPFFPHASLELIRDSDPSFSRHIATVNLIQSQYSWRIGSRIPNGDDYRVRISAGPHIPCLLRSEAQGETRIAPPYPCPLDPVFSASDTSDNPFSVTGTEPPPPDIIIKLKAEIRQLEEAVNQLVRQVQALKALIDAL